MRATFTDEQRTLAEAARDLAKSGREAARTMLDGGELPDEPTASLLSGFAGLAVPEHAGGHGGTLVDLAILLEALGATVTPTPYVAHAVATQVARGAGLDVSAAAAGTVRWTLAEGPTVDGREVSGSARAVREGRSAGAAVVVAGDGAVALAVPSGRHERDAFDRTRPLADLTFDGPAEQVGAGGAEALLRATAAVAAELVGVGRGAVELAAEYAKVREQFGQPVGRFQGVAHQLADAYTGVELAWSLALYACWAVDDGAPDAARAVHAAKAKAGDAAVHAAERCTQTHGGIGITWEADPHLYLRRALADQVWLGDARRHRRELGRSLVRDR